MPELVTEPSRREFKAIESGNGVALPAVYSIWEEC
jgi:hypothetical protein